MVPLFMSAICVPCSALSAGTQAAENSSYFLVPTHRSECHSKRLGTLQKGRTEPFWAGRTVCPLWGCSVTKSKGFLGQIVTVLQRMGLCATMSKQEGGLIIISNHSTCNPYCAFSQSVFLPHPRIHLISLSCLYATSPQHPLVFSPILQVPLSRIPPRVCLQLHDTKSSWNSFIKGIVSRD